MRLFLRVLVAGVAACSLVLPAGGSVRAAGDDPAVDAVLAASRAAMGLDALARVRTIHQRGTVEIVGVAGSGETWSDVRDGRYAQFSEAGPLSGAQGWDGAHAWNRDGSGIVWDDGGAAARYGAVQSVYMNTYALWKPGYGGAAVTSLGRRSDGDRVDDVLRVTPRGGLPFEVWFDAVHRVARTVVPIGTTTTTTTFADYRSVDGLQVPYAIRSENEGGAYRFAARESVANEASAGAALRRPVQHVDDWTLPSGSTTIPFELVDNHVDLEVTIDGKGPYHFLFDTGGSNIIDSGIAKELGLGAAGQMAGQGVGAATEAFAFATVDTLGVGSATLRKQTFVVAPVRAGFGISSGKPVDGLIGFEVLARFVTTFDYGRNQIVLRTPDARSPAQGKTIPFVFNGTHVQIPCAIDGFGGDCTVDTGSRIGLSVDTPFLAAHPSVVPADATQVGANGFGVGGASLGRLGRTTLAFGGFTIPRVITDLSAQTKGAFADPFQAGNIGAAEWKRFSVTFDYPHQTMTLEPNAAFAAEETYDRSGMFLVSQGGAIVIADVRPGTPAAQAGLARGETIVSAGGRSAGDIGLAALREMFRGAPGTAIVLVVQGKTGPPRDVTLTLREYV